jgi:hypothetical protein
MPFNWRKLRDPDQEKGDNRRYRAELTALVLSDDQVKEDGRRVTQNNLLALAWVLGYCLIDEHDHHDAISFFPPKDAGMNLDEWLQHTIRFLKRRGSLLWPRNTYKSTLSLVNCVQLIICWPLTIAIMIVSGRRDLAWEFVGQVASFFVKRGNTGPTLFQALWPELCVSRKPDEGEFTAAIRQTEPEIIEPTIWGDSVESGVSGNHPNVLVIDDITNNRNSQKYETRAAVTKKYKLVRKVLKPIGIELKVGTIYGTGDIFTDEVLTSRPGTVRRVVRPAIVLKNGERLDANGFPDEDDLILNFPQILPYEYLRNEYDSGFESFMTQYQLDEFGAAEVVFTLEQVLGAMVEETQLPLEGETFIHWRFPCAKRNWKTAAMAVGQLRNNRCYVIDAQEGHHKPSILAQIVVNTARTHSLHRIYVEASPGARLMQSAIQNYALTTGWNLSITWTDEAQQKDEDSGERDIRIRNIESVLATGRLYFFAGIKQQKVLIQQFTQYGMIPDNAIPDVIARVADHLPQSIRADEDEEQDLAYKSAVERDHFNLVYGRGKYAPPQIDPREEAQPEPRIEDQRFNEQGLEIMMPGLE